MNEKRSRWPMFVLPGALAVVAGVCWFALGSPGQRPSAKRGAEIPPVETRGTVLVSNSTKTAVLSDKESAKVVRVTDQVTVYGRVVGLEARDGAIHVVARIDGRTVLGPVLDDGSFELKAPVSNTEVDCALSLVDPSATWTCHPVRTVVPQDARAVGPTQLVAVRAYALTVKVGDDSGPVSDADVFVQDDGPKRVSDMREAVTRRYMLRTDAQGVVRFGARPGRHTLVARSRTGAFGEATQLIVGPDGLTEVRLRVESRTKAARVRPVDEDGNPVLDAWVLVERALWPAARAATLMGLTTPPSGARAATADAIVLTGVGGDGVVDLSWAGDGSGPLSVAIGSPRHAVRTARIPRRSENEPTTVSLVRLHKVRVQLSSEGVLPETAEVVFEQPSSSSFDPGHSDAEHVMREFFSEQQGVRDADTWTVFAYPGTEVPVRIILDQAEVQTLIPATVTTGLGPTRWVVRVPEGRFVTVHARGDDVPADVALHVVAGLGDNDSVHVSTLDWSPRRDPERVFWLPNFVAALTPRTRRLHPLLRTNASVRIEHAQAEFDLTTLPAVEVQLEAHDRGARIKQSDVRFRLQRVDRDTPMAPQLVVRFLATDAEGRARARVPAGVYSVHVQHFDREAHRQVMLRGSGPVSVTLELAK